MKKILLGLLFALSAVPILTFLTSAVQHDEVLTTENGMTIINTTELTRDVKGFKGTTPVKIYIKNNKVIRVEALPNGETPKFFERAKAILAAWEGKPVAKAAKTEPDAVSGATFSSNALIKNVQAGLAYYKKKK